MGLSSKPSTLLLQPYLINHFNNSFLLLQILTRIQASISVKKYRLSIFARALDMFKGMPRWTIKADVYLKRKQTSSPRPDPQIVLTPSSSADCQCASSTLQMNQSACALPTFFRQIAAPALRIVAGLLRW